MSHQLYYVIKNGAGGCARGTFQAMHCCAITVKCQFTGKGGKNKIQILCWMSSLRLLLRVANPAFWFVYFFFYPSVLLVILPKSPFYEMLSNSLDVSRFQFCGPPSLWQERSISMGGRRQRLESHYFPQSESRCELSQCVHYCPEAFISIITQGLFKTV